MSSYDAHRPLNANEQLEDVFQWKEQRRLTQNLTLHYKRTLYIVEPSKMSNRLRGKYVQIDESEDGTVRISYRGTVLPARAFAKDGAITQAAVVENKLLGPALMEIRQRQLERDRARLSSGSLNRREKDMLRGSLVAREDDSQPGVHTATPTVDALVRDALRALREPRNTV